MQCILLRDENAPLSLEVELGESCEVLSSWKGPAGGARFHSA